jgi:hypothetical protein
MPPDIHETRFELRCDRTTGQYVAARDPYGTALLG